MLISGEVEELRYEPSGKGVLYKEIKISGVRYKNIYRANFMFTPGEENDIAVGDHIKICAFNLFTQKYVLFIQTASSQFIVNDETLKISIVAERISLIFQKVVIKFAFVYLLVWLMPDYFNKTVLNALFIVAFFVYSYFVNKEIKETSNQVTFLLIRYFGGARNVSVFDLFSLLKNKISKVFK